MKLTEQQKEEITRISKEFASGFEDIEINGSGWLIVDPLSAYLNAMGFENQPYEIPEKGNHPQVLVLEFAGKVQFIPAGGDLKVLHSDFENWIWI